MKLSGIKIDTPNDLLALSYIKEVKKLNKDINIINIRRTNSYHSFSVEDNIASATAIRNKNLNNENISKLIPYSPKLLQNISMNSFYPYLKYKIISTNNNINKYQTVEEGIENRYKIHIHI